MRPTRYDLASGQDTEATQGWQKAQGNRRDVRNQRDLRACGQAADNRGGFSQAYASRSRLGIQSEAVPAPQGISPAKGEGVLLAPQGSKGEWRCLRSPVVPMTVSNLLARIKRNVVTISPPHWLRHATQAMRPITTPRFPRCRRRLGAWQHRHDVGLPACAPRKLERAQA